MCSTTAAGARPGRHRAAQPDPAVHRGQGSLPGPYRHHRRHLLPRPGLVLLPAGRYLERADQTTRLLDIKYHTLLPFADGVGSPLDVSQWNALLRSAAGYHAFRRVHPRGMTPSAVAGFMLYNESFPRSVTTCVTTDRWIAGQAEIALYLKGREQGHGTGR